MNEQLSNARILPDWGSPLTDADYSALEASWVTRELADLAMLRRVDSIAGREVIGQRGNRDCAGILIPYYWPDESCPFNYRLRRDNPEWIAGENGKPKPERKYLGPPNSGNRLYFPPGVTSRDLADPTIPIAVVEGEKKALALWRLACYQTDVKRFVPIAIAGVWNWLGRVGKGNGPQGERVDLKGPIADLSRIEWNTRKAFVIFDTNVHSNESVSRARRGIARELSKRGAEVQFINLPNDCGVNGIDDLLAKWGPERVLDLFNHTESPSTKEGQRTQAQVLTELAADAELFHTTENEAFARIPAEGHHEFWFLRSKGFRRWLVRKFYQNYGKPPGTQALQDAIGFLEAKAQFDAPEARLFVRVAEYGDRIYVDLCNAKGQAVEISREGWRVVIDPPVGFRRAKGMQSLPVPTSGGSLTLLKNLINVGDQRNWVLCASWLLAACRQKGPYPILILQGEQGSAKSTMEKLLRRIIDPSTALVRTPPRDGRDLLITAGNSWIIAYDNLSGIPQWLSDSFCRLATGGGFSTRELYTDGEEVFFEAMRPIILNGIDHLAERADLADRALILNLPHIDSKERRDEGQLYAEFERDLPQILGALFAAVSAALRHLSQTKLDSKPRMADFALWATAAEEALGLEAGAFMAVYQNNRAEAVQETLEADPVGATMLMLIDKCSEENEAAVWEGTCKDLLSQLEQFVDDRTKKSRRWPQTPRGLSGRLRRLVTFFRESGVRITFHPKTTKGQRSLTITGMARHSSAATAKTAAECRDCMVDQSVAVPQVGGGSVAGVAVESPQGDQPLFQGSIANTLNGRENSHSVAVEAKMAVACAHIPDAQTAPAEASDRPNFCVNCGPTDWQWARQLWVCPTCGKPARGQRIASRDAELERYEL